MDEYAAELPRKFISFQCLENESTKKRWKQHRNCGDFPNFPRASELETVMVAETETSPTKSLVLIHITAVGECVANDDVDIVAKGVSVASQECLLSNSVKE